MDSSATRPKVILRLAQVVERTGLSRSTLYQLLGNGEFPPQIKLGIHSVGWLEAEIDEWILSRIANSRKVAS